MGVGVREARRQRTVMVGLLSACRCHICFTAEFGSWPVAPWQCVLGVQPGMCVVGLQWFQVLHMVAPRSAMVGCVSLCVLGQLWAGLPVGPAHPSCCATNARREQHMAPAAV